MREIRMFAIGPVFIGLEGNVPKYNMSLKRPSRIAKRHLIYPLAYFSTR